QKTPLKPPRLPHVLKKGHAAACAHPTAAPRQTPDEPRSNSASSSLTYRKTAESRTILASKP
ncbi:MAG TPA: hypothetical protein VIM11_16850, partial [Tepidisphaeraceae bacterium]